ncbi:MAG: TRAP transporter small permease [Aquisalimonadaceae bacterium]
MTRDFTLKGVWFLNRVLDWVTWPIMQLCELVLGSLLFAAVAINVANVVGRYVLGSSLGWAEEVLTYSMIWGVFIGGILVTLKNDHLCVDLLAQYLPPLGRRLLDILILLGLIGCCVYVARQSEQVLALFSRTGQRSTVAGLPMVWIHGAIMVGFTMMAIAGGLRLLRVAVDSANIALCGQPLLRDHAQRGL